jgi:hypothetical protein
MNFRDASAAEPGGLRRADTRGEDRGIMTKIAVVTGNPKPASRTHSVALAVAAALAKELPGADTDPVIDLAGYAPRLFDWSDEELTGLTARVAAAESPRAACTSPSPSSPTWTRRSAPGPLPPSP